MLLLLLLLLLFMCGSAVLLASAALDQAWASSAESVSVHIPLNAVSSWASFAAAGYKITGCAADAFQLVASARGPPPDSLSDLKTLRKLGKQ